MSIGWAGEKTLVKIGKLGWIEGIFSIKSAGVLKWVFENIRKRSKIFKNWVKIFKN
jgi:hypothetical protein